MTRVLVIHNRYRVHGGEERAVELQLEALRQAGVEHRALVRDSADTGRMRAASSLLRGGLDPAEVGDAVRSLGADVVHAHNMQPLFGPRALAAARDAGARVVLHLHNFRLFCAIGVAFRLGEPCFRCHHGRTLPGLALNCRRSWPEAAVYAAALRRQYPDVLEVVDRFVAPSRYATGQLERLGVPGVRLEALPHHLPDEAFAARSQAAEGEYALVAGRLAQEKGIETAIDAAGLAGVPLKVAGDGPLLEPLRERARLAAAPVEMLGRVPHDELARLLRHAAVVLVPSRSDESFGLSALEAMGAGVPVVATRAGALVELLGEERCVPRHDPSAMVARLGELWRDPGLRADEGAALLERARASYGRERYTRALLDLYARVVELGS
ncbi:MAG TPA: glycosyltransferase family 4 protein [Thermoleophilaceae bacterium]|nr:glycosyltransferase family 4 protein [Thermoleophilaceae bacterium]